MGFQNTELLYGYADVNVEMRQSWKAIPYVELHEVVDAYRKKRRAVYFLRILSINGLEDWWF